MLFQIENYACSKLHPNPLSRYGVAWKQIYTLNTYTHFHFRIHNISVIGLFIITKSYTILRASLDLYIALKRPLLDRVFIALCVIARKRHNLNLPLKNLLLTNLILKMCRLNLFTNFF